MNYTRLTAQQLAAKGRFGDTMLIHVNPAEVAGIASLIPGGLTINPETGLPEAFFFLPFLASLFGAAAPAAAAATAAAPALAGAAGAAAAGAGTAAATGLGTLGTALSTLPSTLASLPAAAAHGIGSLFGAGTAAAAPAAAAAPVAELAGAGGANALMGGAGVDAITTGSIANAALPTATSVIPTAAPVASSGLPGITSALPVTKSSLIAAGPSAPGYTSAVSAANPLTSSVGAGTSAPGYTGAAKTVADAAPSVTPVHVIHPPNPTVLKPGANALIPKTDGGGGILSGIGDYLKKNPIMAMGLASQALGSVSKLFGSGKKKKSSKKLGSYKDLNGDPVFNDPTTAGQSEHNFFPNYDYNAYAAQGGLVRGYANGGIVSLAGGGPVDPQAQMPQDMTFPLNGVPGGGGDEAPMLEDIPSSNFPTSQIGSTPEPPPGDPANTVTAPNMNDHELIAQTVEAIQGKLADPRPVLLAFVNEFGEPALQDLAMRVKGQAGQKGPGDGTSDSIPARLSEGEFVVPADTVSALGNGSTEAGGRQLQGMVDNVRTAKGGAPEMPPQIPPGGIASMMGGGLVRGYKDGGVVGQFPPELRWALEDRAPTDEEWTVDYITPEEDASRRLQEQRDRRYMEEGEWYEPDLVNRGRLPGIYENPNVKPIVIPERGYTKEWAKNVEAYQNARRAVGGPRTDRRD